MNLKQEILNNLKGKEMKMYFEGGDNESNKLKTIMGEFCYNQHDIENAIDFALTAK